MLSIFKKKDSKEIIDEAENQLKSMVNEGQEMGMLQSQEAQMINNIFEFDDKNAKDIMIHRSEIVAINGDALLSEAIEIFRENTYSRFPVFIEDLDNIIGIIHMRELFEFSLEKPNHHKKIRDLDNIMKAPLFFPETHSINMLLSKMQHAKTHMVIIKDEYGQTSGLVSLEDIIEEIVGNILDEHDEEDTDIIDRGNGMKIMFGRTKLEDVEDSLGIDFDTEDFETLNGFLTNELGRIPNEGESFVADYGGYTFEVQSVKDNIIQGIKVFPKVEEEETK